MWPSHHDCAFVFLLTKWYCGEVDRTFGQHRETSAKEKTPARHHEGNDVWPENNAFRKFFSLIVYYHFQLFCKKNIHVKRYMKNNKIEKIDRHGLT